MLYFLYYYLTNLELLTRDLALKLKNKKVPGRGGGERAGQAGGRDGGGEGLRLAFTVGLVKLRFRVRPL